MPSWHTSIVDFGNVIVAFAMEKWELLAGNEPRQHTLECSELLFSQIGQDRFYLFAHVRLHARLFAVCVVKATIIRGMDHCAPIGRTGARHSSTGPPSCATRSDPRETRGRKATRCNQTT